MMQHHPGSTVLPRDTTTWSNEVSENNDPLRYPPVPNTTNYGAFFVLECEEEEEEVVESWGFRSFPLVSVLFIFINAECTFFFFFF